MLRGAEFVTLQSGYFDACVSTRKLVNRFRREPMLEEVEFDTLVGTGLSGGLVVPRLAEALKLHWLVVRKDGEGSHSTAPAYGRLGRHWLFVDDFLSTGRTWLTVRKKVDDTCTYWEPGFKTVCVGAFWYERGAYEPVDVVEDTVSPWTRRHLEEKWA